MQRPVTHVAFAEAIGCHYTLVTRYRSGDRLPTVEHLARMIEVFDLDPNEAIAAVNRANEKDSATGEKTDPMAFARYLRDSVFTAPGEGEQDRPATLLLSARIELKVVGEPGDAGEMDLLFEPVTGNYPPVSLTLSRETALLFTRGERYDITVRAAAE